MLPPPGPPSHLLGQHVPGTTVLIPYALEQARLAAEAVGRSQQFGAAEALAAHRRLMAGRWFIPEHTWAAVYGDVATVGLTDYAAGELHNFLYVSLPAVGATAVGGSPCGQVESVRAIWGLYAPGVGQTRYRAWNSDSIASLLVNLYEG